MALWPEPWLNFSGEVAHQQPEWWLRHTVICTVGTNDKVKQFLPYDGENCVGNGCGAGQRIRVEVASNPEFLPQGMVVWDILHDAWIIIGTDSQWAEEILMKTNRLTCRSYQ